MINEATITATENPNCYRFAFLDEKGSIVQIDFGNTTMSRLDGQWLLRQINTAARKHNIYKVLYSLHRFNRIKIKPESLKVVISHAAEDNWDVIKEMRRENLI